MFVNAGELSKNLVDVIESMLTASRALGDETTAQALEHQAVTLRKGLVRVALVGNTSSGKSTIINALLQHIVVPENPSVCSPVPVWIYHHTGEHAAVEVIRRCGNEKEFVKTDPDDFMTEYCYNISDITNVERVRFDNILEANIEMENDIFSTGAILIDTLGIAATAVDTRKTLAVLNEGVDLVVFASKNAQLMQDEVSFLREYILGFEPEKHKVNYPVAPQNLLFILNWFQNGSRPRYTFINSLARVFDGTEYLQSQEALEEWGKTNVFDVQALFARLKRCGGAYPYSRLAPAGSSESEKKGLIEREKRENALLSVCENLSDKNDDFGFIALQDGLMTHIRRRTTGRESIGFTRIYALQRILKQIRGAANARVQDEAKSVDDFQVLKQKVNKIENQLTVGNHDLQSALKKLGDEYISAFNNVFTAVCSKNGTAYEAAHGHVQRMELAMPDSFKNNFHPNNFIHMSSQEQIDFLNSYVEDMIVDVTATCREMVTNAIQEQRVAGPGGMLPMEVLEKSRCYVTSQGKSLNGYIASLERLGVRQKLGVMLPEEHEVDAIFVSLQTDLEQHLLDAVSDALARGKDKFNTYRSNFMKNISNGFLNRILAWVNTFSIFDSNIKQRFWERICKYYLEPLVDCCLDSLGKFNGANVKGGLQEAVADAYQQVMIAIIEHRNGLDTALKHSVIRVDEQIATHGQVADDVRNEMSVILDSCDELDKKLNEYQQGLFEQI